MKRVVELMPYALYSIKLIKINYNRNKKNSTPPATTTECFDCTTTSEYFQIIHFHTETFHLSDIADKMVETETLLLNYNVCTKS